MGPLAVSLGFSCTVQGLGYKIGKSFKFAPRKPSRLSSMGDIGSALWKNPAVKAGLIRLIGGTYTSIYNDF